MDSAKSLIPSLQNIINGNVDIDPNCPIWYSKFKHDEWIFISEESPYFRGDEKSCINWNSFLEGSDKTKNQRYERCLTQTMINELKIVAFIYSNYPALLPKSKTKKTTVDGKTVKDRILELVKIGSMLVKYARNEKSIEINSFSDITYDMLKTNAPIIGGRPDHLKRALCLIAEPSIQKCLPTPLQFTSRDVRSKSIFWGTQKSKEHIATLSDAQFLFLLNYCKQSISEFKQAMKFDIHDNDISDYARADIVEKFTDGKSILEDYIWVANSKYPNLKINHGYTIGELVQLYRNAHLSSMLIILLFTGMRDTEFTVLKKGSLAISKTDGLKYLFSLVIKRENEAKPETDKWLVIPLVEDAYDILLYACEKTGNNYLFSSPVKVVRKNGQGYSNLNEIFNRFIQKIDVNNLFTNYSFSVHQCRETLVYQLAKHKVGLPFISKQLKHFYNRFNKMPNEVTSGYGNYKSNLFFSIQSKMAMARENVLNDIYGEGKTFAGGGGKAHKARIDAWFKGNGLFGEDRINYIKKLANSSVSLMTTSIGICSHNFIANADGELPPPCLGDYTCDPDCHNHVISEGCASALKERKKFALNQSEKEENLNVKISWIALSEQLDKHIDKFSKSGDANE